MKNICKYIGIVILILGIIGSFIISSKLGNLGYERNWGLTIGYFVGGVFVTVVQSIILFALSELLSDHEFLSEQIEESQKQ